MLSKIKSTAKNSIIYGIGNLSTKLIGFILLPIYTRIFPVEDYGVLAMLETSSQILISVFGLNLYTAYFRWYWDKKFENKRESLFFTVYIFLVLIILLMLGLVFGLSETLATYLLENQEYNSLIKLMSITAAFEIIGILPLTLLRLQEKPKIFISANILKFSINLIFTLYFILGLKRHINAIYEAQIIGNITFFLFLSRYMWKHSTIRFEWEALKNMLVFSIPLVLTSVAGVFFSITDRYLLKFISGLKELGSYQFGFKITNAIKLIIINSISFAITPLIFKLINDPDNKRIYTKMLTYLGFMVMFMVIFLSTFGKEITMLITERTDYWDAFVVIPFLSTGLFFYALKEIAITGLNISKRTKVIALITIITSVLNIIFNLLFIYYFKSIGAAIATCLSQAILFLLILRHSQKYYFIPFEYSKIIKLFFTGVILISVSLSTNNIPILSRLLIKTSLLISYPFILYLLNFYEEIEIERIKGFFKKWKNPRYWKRNLKRN